MKKSAALFIAFCVLAIIPAAAQQDTIRTDVDLVVVPVSVKSSEGRFVYDLQKQDFSVLEDGRLQEISQFSTDAAPLSVAVLIDTNIESAALRRLASSLASLRSSLTADDEAEVYRFDNVITKVSDFTSNQDELERRLAILQTIAEQKRDSAWTWTLFPGRGPRWLRWLLDNSTDTALVLDAVFAAGVDLEKREKSRRKVILVITDGRAARNTYSLEQVEERLVRSEVQLYGVTVSLPLVDSATGVLGSLATTTGGDVHSGRTQSSMDAAFSRVTEQARHQYVLSYVSNNEVGGILPVERRIEVKTKSGLSVNHRRAYLQYPKPR